MVDRAERVKELESKLVERLYEILSSIKVVKGFARELFLPEGDDIERSPAENPSDELPAADEGDVAERFRPQGRARRIRRQLKAEVGVLLEPGDVDALIEVQGDWYDDSASGVASRSAARSGDHCCVGAETRIKRGPDSRKISEGDDRSISVDPYLESEIVVVRTRGRRVSGGKFRIAGEDCVNRRQRGRLGRLRGNAIGELLLQPGELQVEPLDESE